jgi:hypothetical protein
MFISFKIIVLFINTLDFRPLKGQIPLRWGGKAEKLGIRKNSPFINQSEDRIYI